MLDPWIIEEILRREQEQRRPQDDRRPFVPLDQPRYHEREPSKPSVVEETPSRGVTVIEI